MCSYSTKHRRPSLPYKRQPWVLYSHRSTGAVCFPRVLSAWLRRKESIYDSAPKFRSDTQVRQNSSERWHGIISHRQGNPVPDPSNRSSAFNILEAEPFFRKHRHLRWTETSRPREMPCFMNVVHNLLYFSNPRKDGRKRVQRFDHQLWGRWLPGVAHKSIQTLTTAG